ncbi:hypothetical protein AB2B41_08255 [Marimonas sp. MJW-29]|uniref:Clp protease n=1 Tax=Sulfitobacter sediminis TaxID=3234186 RepID=A0ABV3RLN4_9RHOB
MIRGGAAWIRRLAPALLCLALPGAALAERFSVSGERLIFDTIALVDGEPADISGDDVEQMRDVLRANPDIRVLEINSTGGGHYPSMELAALVIDFELDTHVEETCQSSCVPVFLGGAKRTMARGARIGFHQLSWDAEAVENYYNENREGFGWETPFDFAEWMYEDTQTETYNRLAYMVSRGVDPEFAIRTIRKPDTTLWFPYRSVLMAAGVLTD